MRVLTKQMKVSQLRHEIKWRHEMRVLTKQMKASQLRHEMRVPSEQLQ